MELPRYGDSSNEIPKMGGKCGGAQGEQSHKFYPKNLARLESILSRFEWRVGQTKREEEGALG
jgi:hypothetical protein